jgi:hypothetical protein
MILRHKTSAVCVCAERYKHQGEAIAFSGNGQDLILFYEFPSDAILDGDFPSRIVYNDRIAEFTAAFITSPRT